MVSENMEVLFHSVPLSANSYWKILRMLRDHSHIHKHLKGGYNEDGARCPVQAQRPSAKSGGSTAELGSTGTRRVLGSPPWTSPNLDMVLGRRTQRCPHLNHAVILHCSQN